MFFLLLPWSLFTGTTELIYHHLLFLLTVLIPACDSSNPAFHVIARRNMNNLRYEDDITLKAESKEELKSLFKRLKEESGKSWLKSQHSKN